MNLEEKENTAEAAPEAAAQVTIQAVQENNVPVSYTHLRNRFSVRGKCKERKICRYNLETYTKKSLPRQTLMVSDGLCALSRCPGSER